MANPSYLLRNRHGAFYFRAVIPKHLLAHFQHQREIKKSLKTDSRRLAVVRARAYRAELDKTLQRLMDNDAEDTFRLELIQTIEIEFPDGRKERHVTIDNPTPEESEALRLLAAIQTPATPQPAKRAIRSASLSQVIDEYIKSKLQDESWEPDGPSHDQGQTRLDLILEILGDRPCGELTELDAIKVEETLPLIPANRNADKLSELPTLQAKIDTDPETVSRLGRRTQARHWELFTSLMQFARKKRYIAEDGHRMSPCWTGLACRPTTRSVIRPRHGRVWHRATL